MAAIATYVAFAHIGDRRRRALALDLQGGDESVFGFDRDARRTVADPRADHVAQAHGITPPPHRVTPSYRPRWPPATSSRRLAFDAHYPRGIGSLVQPSRIVL